MKMLATRISESAVRSKASKRLWRLVKYRENSKWYAQYGPYALVGERNVSRHAGLDLSEASGFLDSIPI